MRFHEFESVASTRYKHWGREGHRGIRFIEVPRSRRRRHQVETNGQGASLSSLVDYRVWGSVVNSREKNRAFGVSLQIRARNVDENKSLRKRHSVY